MYNLALLIGVILLVLYFFTGTKNVLFLDLMMILLIGSELFKGLYFGVLKKDFSTYQLHIVASYFVSTNRYKELEKQSKGGDFRLYGNEAVKAGWFYIILSLLILGIYSYLRLTDSFSRF